MNDDTELSAALMARIERHFARQSEIAEATKARMENGLERAKEIQAGLAAMTETLDRMESSK